MNRIAIIETDITDDIFRQLQISGFVATLLPDINSLKSWLTENRTDVLMLRPSPFNKKISIESTRIQSNWRLDSRLLELFSPNGKRIALTQGESYILQAASQSNEHPISRKTLIKALGEDARSYDERRLETLISRLRRKLTSCNEEEQPIRAIKGRGYLFRINLLDVKE